MQTQKWVNLGLLGAATALFLLFSQVFRMVWDWGGWAVAADWPIEPVYLISFFLAVVMAFGARWSKPINGFINEVALELSRVTWPQRKETIGSSGVVIVLVGVAAVVLFIIDLVWGTATRGLFKY